MNHKIRIGSNGTTLTLNDRHYKASGGEASIYIHGNKAYKLYHEPDKKMLPPRKMQELAAITSPQVVLPKEVVYDAAKGIPLGYTTDFVDNAEPLLKLFTRTFKDDNNISFQMINELVKQTQLIVADVHSAKCLIVDLNELNVLAKINSTVIEPWFIDVDSYSTPSFKATAIMDSVRDRRVSKVDSQGVLHYHPDEMSDWFSWAIITFCLYTNIHPFRGSHKDYRPKDKQKQMDDGISIFHSGVRTPPSVNDFKVIPKRHLEWYKEIFLKNERSAPPLADSSIPLLVPTQIVTIQGTDKITVAEIIAYSDAIVSVHQFMGIYYVVTKKNIYAGKKEIGTTTHGRKTLICNANDGTPIIAHQVSNKVTFNELTCSTPVGTINSMDMFVRNGVIYTITNSKMVENSFAAFGDKIIHRMTDLENVSLSAKMYDGCIIQDLLGKKYLTLPYKSGSAFSKHISQLDGYRIIDAKSDKTVTVVIAEKDGAYNRFIILFDKRFTDFQVRKTEDIAYDAINFAVMENGLCILLSSPTEMELFSTATQYETLTNPPFDATMKLFTTSDGIFFVNGNSIHQIRRK
jgi:hypothetical protein